MKITQFSIEEVRCFAERQNFEIRPLTFLVGENSTGKTTALGCFQALANCFTEGVVDFNRSPYKMDYFEDIVRNSRKKEKIFKLGFNFEHGKENVEWILEFGEDKETREPVVGEALLKFHDGEIVCKPDLGLELDTHIADFDIERNKYYIIHSYDLMSGFPPSAFLRYILSEAESEDEKALQKYLKTKPTVLWRDKPTLAFSIAPVRSHPKQSYNSTKISDDPEGSDVPMQLMERKATKKEDWEALKQQLIKFGHSSGLFQNIEIVNMKSRNTSFKLKIKARGPSTKISDVGYGVSQILPILVQILDLPSSLGPITEMPFSLLQQPEIHLHPKAQAEISSLLATLAGQGKRSFIIETHSDYIIDRARIEIRKGTISPDDVSLIYLEPKARVVKVHNISFDEMANMIGVPKHYGAFFLKETDQLMGFEE
ncbi:MAG: AAA family ATPase [Candidatus Poribacteria bacterium]|nr:AAA family ATPase [Candidatus Poribacteria bacterium]MDE0504873.1 AAA family ATPase [Candidatus Poribacteria bacterium]